MSMILLTSVLTLTKGTGFLSLMRAYMPSLLTRMYLACSTFFFYCSSTMKASNFFQVSGA